MTVKYKQAKAVQDIYSNLDRFINYMNLIGKNGFKLYITRDQHTKLIEDINKKAKSDGIKIKSPSFDEYKGFEVSTYH